MRKPALSFAAVPGRRAKTIELAAEIESRGFTGLFCPSFGDGLALCEAMAFKTRDIVFGTSIVNIYARHPLDYAQTAAFLHEISGGRFRFGVGVSHDFFNHMLGVKTGKPLADMRTFVADLHKAGKRSGGLPPVILAALRRKMVRLAGEIAQGVVWANASCSHMPASLQELPIEKRSGDFFIGNMIPTCVSDDHAAAAAVMRRALRDYVQLPNYQMYWIEAGYEDEMRDIQETIKRGERDKLLERMSDRWLRDVTLFGTAAEVREGVERWRAAGVHTPMLVPSSASGGQMEAFQEVFAAFA
jgi:alkanesulfonate monooxygenase SsuD/methylene tetrahydromethanopterin reductase-like flavin-dependent oxidoreductase (luciferase family)